LKKKVPPERLTVCQNGATYTVGGVGIQAIKGKHIGPITLYHLSMGNIAIFHGGDSAYVTLKAYPAHLAFIPVGDPSPTCSPTMACKMALDVAPQVVVAMHGSPSQYESFTAKMAAELPETRVIIPTRSQFQSVSISQ
jgi:L-ascorbate metabolism protein UlaG (beta-lactamase superfamily)